MGAMSMESLPLGFRFRPTDEELINHYLRLKINGRHSDVQVIPEVDVCKWEPWDLPGLSVIKMDDPEWFFFCPRDRKYPNGHRSNRATHSGYWKATGKDRTIKSKKTQIGMKKTLVFYRGRAPKGERTNWIMHEYRPTQKELDGSGPGQSPFVLCRLFHKPGDRVNGVKSDETEQIGATPSSSKSSPDDASSDLVQETATSDTAVEKPSNDTERWFTGKCGDVATDGGMLNPEDTGNYMAYGAPVEEYSLHGQNPSLNWLTCDPGDQTTSLHIESPYAFDFGDDIIGSQFQNGTSEFDASLTELLDEVFNNPEESSCEESARQKCVTFSSGNASPLQSATPENAFLNDIGTYSDSDAEMVQLQYDPYFGAGCYPESKESLLMQGSFGSVNDQVVQDDALAASPATQSYYNNFIHPSDQMNAGSNFTDGTGIKIRARHPQNRPNTGFVNQGTAPRRIRLQMQSNSVSPVEKKQSEGEKGVPEVVHKHSEYCLQAGKAEIKPQIKIRTRRSQDVVKAESEREVEVSEKKGSEEAEVVKMEKGRIREKSGVAAAVAVVAVVVVVVGVVGMMGAWWISLGS